MKSYGLGYLPDCRYKDNVKWLYFDKSLSPEIYPSYQNPPRELNRNNDCKWYKKKFWKFWVK